MIRKDVIIAKALRFSKKVPPTGFHIVDTIVTVIEVASAAKDVYDWFTEDKEKKK